MDSSKEPYFLESLAEAVRGHNEIERQKANFPQERKRAHYIIRRVYISHLRDPSLMRDGCFLEDLVEAADAAEFLSIGYDKMPRRFQKAMVYVADLWDSIRK